MIIVIIFILKQEQKLTYHAKIILMSNTKNIHKNCIIFQFDVYLSYAYISAESFEKA